GQDCPAAYNHAQHTRHAEPCRQAGDAHNWRGFISAAFPSPMRYAKPALTLEQQQALLRARGLLWMLGFLQEGVEIHGLFFPIGKNEMQFICADMFGAFDPHDFWLRAQREVLRAPARSINAL